MARARQVADLLDQFALYTLLPCACGMRIKVPPEFHRDQVECPRCERVNFVPKAEATSQEQVPGVSGEGDRPITGEAQPAGGSTLEYTRRDDGWDAFRCACGQTIQLGPDFPLDYTVCGKCDRRIELRGQKIRGPDSSRDREGVVRRSDARQPARWKTMSPEASKASPMGHLRPLGRPGSAKPAQLLRQVPQ